MAKVMKEEASGAFEPFDNLCKRKTKAV